jgi:hypothetical protein
LVIPFHFNRFRNGELLMHFQDNRFSVTHAHDAIDAHVLVTLFEGVIRFEQIPPEDGDRVFSF